jgi:hypothetical protein
VIELIYLTIVSLLTPKGEAKHELLFNFSLSLALSPCLYICLPLSLCINISITLFICLSLFLLLTPPSLSLSLSIYLSIFLSLCLFPLFPTLRFSPFCSLSLIERQDSTLNLRIISRVFYHSSTGSRPEACTVKLFTAIIYGFS